MFYFTSLSTALSLLGYVHFTGNGFLCLRVSPRPQTDRWPWILTDCVRSMYVWCIILNPISGLLWIGCHYLKASLFADYDGHHVHCTLFLLLTTSTSFFAFHCKIGLDKKTCSSITLTCLVSQIFVFCSNSIQLNTEEGFQEKWTIKDAKDDLGQSEHVWGLPYYHPLHV